MTDPVKINQIFDKILHANNLEIEERNLRNLAQKINLKLLDKGYLVSNHSSQVTQLFGWLQVRAGPLFSGQGGPETCSMTALQNFGQIFDCLASSLEGRALIFQAGGKQFFTDLLSVIPPTEVLTIQQLESVMRRLLEAEEDPSGILPSGGFRYTGSFNQTAQIQNQDLERESLVNETFPQQESHRDNQSQMSEARLTQQNLQSSSAMQFSRKNFSITGAAPQLAGTTELSHHGGAFANTQNAPQMAQSQMSAHQSIQRQPSGLSQISGGRGTAQGMLHSTDSRMNLAHMEMMHKQQVLKEECELPFVVLSDRDEKELFDLSVALKFGNPQTVFASCQKLSSTVFFDFPPEIFLQRTDIVKALLDLLEGQTSAAQESQWDPSEIAQSTLLVLLGRFKLLYKFLLSKGCKPSSTKKIDKHVDDLEEEAKQTEFVEEYIQKTYPNNRLSRWDPDLVEGAKKKVMGTVAGIGGQNSLSCKAVIGLILTKSIYLLQDTGRVGIFVQLIQEAISALTEIYNVEENKEFSEFIHLALLAFDKVCDFYREQLFDEVLIQPILPIILNVVKLLNSIPSSSSYQGSDAPSDSKRSTRTIGDSQRSLASHFKSPFTDTLAQNTENLQRMLRRCLFRNQFLEGSEKYETIQMFFERLENQEEVGEQTLQRNVRKTFAKAQDSYQRFMRVTEFRVETSQMGDFNDDEVCFVTTKGQLQDAMAILDDLKACLEMKMDFPFEHILIDCVSFAGLQLDSAAYSAVQDSLESEGGAASGKEKIAEVEKMFKLYLSIPIPEVRERILRKFYSKLRTGFNAVEKSARPRSLSNNLYLARFLLRKGILNHFVNGILINRDIAEQEETRLQMTLGQLIVKLIILAFNEIQGNSSTMAQRVAPDGGPQFSEYTQALNQFLLTFQCLLPVYPDLISLIELIEEAGQKNCRYLRILRDLFSSQPHKREFATNVVRTTMSLDSPEEHSTDILMNCIDLRQPSSRVYQNLELINSNFDFSTFGIQDIVNILQSSQQDYGIKKSSLEQLTMVLFDVINKRGRFLFSQSTGSQDVFSFVLGEVLAAYDSAKHFLKGKVSNLERDQVLFINEAMRFLFYSFIFFNDEPVIQEFFNRAKLMVASRKVQEKQQAQIGQFEQLLNALVFFLGAPHLRESAILLLYVSVYQQLWISTKIQKQQAPNGSVVRSLSILIPDFCQESIVQLVPYLVQAIRMPQRNDLILSEEQKMYIEACFTTNQKLNQEYEQLSIVGDNLVRSVQGMRAADYRKVLVTGIAQWKNYLLSLEALRDQLVNASTLNALIEMLKVLPTRDFEYWNLGDMLAILSSILESHKAFLSDGAYQKESVANSIEFLVRIMDALKYHLMPYLEETALGGLDDPKSPKLYLVYRYLELMNLITSSDMALKQYSKGSLAKEFMVRPGLLAYFIQLFQYLKNEPSIKKKILSLFWSIHLHYQIPDRDQVNQIADCLVEEVSATTMVYNHFDKANSVMWCFRFLILLSQRRQLRLDLSLKATDDSINQQLSGTFQGRMEKYKSYGWILRFTESRDARLRVLTWDLLTELFDYDFLRSHPSVVHQSINTYLKDTELYCVKISVLKFLNKVCQALIQNCEADEQGDLSSVMENSQEVTVQTLLQTLNRQGLISQMHLILAKKDYPLHFLTLSLQLLFQLTQMDYKKSIAVLTQLDYWTFLVELLDLSQLIEIEKHESRPILRTMGCEGEPSILRNPDPTAQLDMVYMSINAVLDFLFEAFKRDSQLAALLVKTTKLMEYVFGLVKSTLGKWRGSGLRLRNKGLLTVFIDKAVKILHVAMLHPQDYSVDLISKFLFEQPIKDGRRLPRNWLLFIEMFAVIDEYNQTLGFTDIKLALIRFISEFLIQVSHFHSNFLDELVDLEVKVVATSQATYHEGSLASYGSMLFIEFAKVFKALYIDAPRLSAEDCENQRKDITLCLDILFTSSKSAKSLAIDQNFLKKVIDLAQEHCSALYALELSKYTGTKSQVAFDQQLHKQLRHVRDPSDPLLCEREAQRMLQMMRNLFFSSGNLLNLQDQDQALLSRQDRKPKRESTSDKLISLFAQILEELGQSKSNEGLVCECLMTMITFASQNQKFKHCFLQPASISTQSKKVNLLKLIADRVPMSHFQTNSRQVRLIFTLLRTLSLSPDVVKEVMKLRIIENVASKILPLCKNDRDIKTMKHFLGFYIGFLCGFTRSEEGQRQILKIKEAFDLSLFVLDTVNIPANPSGEMGPLTHLVYLILLFIRNSTFENRSNKVHFLKNDDFLPCLMAFLTQHNQHPLVRGQTAAVLWSLVHNHQGIKAAINKSAVISELQSLRSQYQRDVDRLGYLSALSADQQPRAPEALNDYHANMTVDDVTKNQEAQAEVLKQTNEFVAKALSGILTLVQA